jgi:hypothetical protein
VLPAWWGGGFSLKNPDVFAVEDLVHLRDERRVIWGLYDIARRTRFVRVPRLVWLERLRYMQRPKSGLPRMLGL